MRMYGCTSGQGIYKKLGLFTNVYKLVLIYIVS